jgi:hypothetical protein
MTSFRTESAVTPNCTGKAGQPCCYFQSKSEIVGMLPTPLFDCWDRNVVPPPPAPAPPTQPSCCCAACTLAAECKGMGGAGVTPACPSQQWRNPTAAANFFASTSTSTGVGAALHWLLDFSGIDATTHQRLAYHAVVAGNGTIVSMVNSTGGRLAPLRQFRMDGLR